MFLLFLYFFRSVHARQEQKEEGNRSVMRGFFLQQILADEPSIQQQDGWMDGCQSYVTIHSADQRFGQMSDFIYYVERMSV
jgi:hypothetical protein